MLQTTIPENLIETSHASGKHVHHSCYYHVSEITQSGSPLTPWHQKQADAKLKRITSDAMDRITEIQLSRKHMHYGPLTAITAVELKSIYGSDMYTPRVRREKNKHLTQVLRGYKHEGMEFGVVSLYSPTPEQTKHTLDYVDRKLELTRDEIELNNHQLIAANRAIERARRASSTRTTREFAPAEHEVELLGTAYELERAVEIAEGTRKQEYIDFKNRCRIDENKLFLPVSYTEDWTGRLHCQQLANISAPVREAMFKGFYSHDIESCMPSLWIQMYKELQATEQRTVFRRKPRREELLYPPTPALDEYFADIEQARHRIMRLLDVDYKTAKGVYNFTCGGMSIPGCVWHLSHLMSLNKQPAILKLLTPGQALRLGQTDWFREFRREIRMVQKAIRRRHRKKNKFVITNAAGKKLFLANWRDYMRMNVFIWMGVERQILDVARQFCNPAVTLHDGFITKDPITDHQYEQLVFEQTGWRINDKVKHL